ncbi:NAC transcription factor 29-like [Dorcoceras hygrometricum]|uniref:NAC transcription factor 29-like n=1 Tax=Dorcoceras hygrometricum TaxID=472368 RepID=A0A2Z7D6T0_9LAMI|nr:NAC transcription factor 29-like [Dorcoceras hygrometricum]
MDSTGLVLSLSPGYRFSPKDHELINEYLKKKIDSQTDPCLNIFTTNIYKNSPRELTALYPSMEEGEWYFLTPRNRGDQRVAGNGYWKAYGTEKQIHHNNICIGSKRSLKFYEGKPPKSKKSNWVIEEYAVDKQQEDAINMMQIHEDYVLCRIRMSLRSKKEAAASKSCETKKQKAKSSRLPLIHEDDGLSLSTK